ncbi:MAG: uroporphyrinogen-III synthase [Acidimicrobiales bacterium]
MSGRLAGLTVVVTRPGDQAAGLRRALQELGARTVALPTVELVDPADGGAALAAAAGRLADYDWVVVTSVNGARRLTAAARTAGAGPPRRAAAIGPATAAALEAAGWPASLVPEEFVAEALLEALPAPPAPGARLLLARAAEAREVLPEGLAARGWAVEVVEAYRTRVPPASPAALGAVAEAHAVLFTSPSTFRGFLQIAGRSALPGVVASIGPVTTAAIEAEGVPVDVEAAVHTTAGLVAALAAWWEGLHR